MASERSQNFIRDIIDEDLARGRYDRVVTRFPPEPNGFPHIGHVKSICLNFGLAEVYGGVCHLRMDDTNPSTEDVAYVRAMQDDIRWLGFDWGDRMFYASDYFGAIHDHAVGLIERGLAYVDDASEDEIRAARGSLSEPGRPTPSRARSVADNLERFARMRAGALPDGSHVLRARIDLAAANMKMRDPLLYRIRHAHHYRTGDAWCIYPMYDFAHPLSDAIEGITHSICTLEFENNRELYDWVLEACATPARPRQIEMARLALGYTVMSKRKLLRLVNERKVDGWDDPRMPTIAGLRRRGVPPAALRGFAELVGVAKANSTVDIGKFWHCVHDEVNRTSPRRMCVERPIAVELTNLAAPLELDAPDFPPDVGAPGGRAVRLEREIWIDGDDVAAAPGPKERKLTPGGKVRLRHAHVVRCDEVVRDATGAIVRLRCSIEEDSLGKATGDKDLGVIQWVPATGAVPATLRAYGFMFDDEKPDELEDFMTAFDPASKAEHEGALVEPSVRDAAPGARFQFERKGYFVVDPDSTADRRVFARTTGLGAERPRARPAAAAAERVKNTKAATRPKLMSPVEARAIARERDPALAARLREFAAIAGVRPEHADFLSGAASTAGVAARAIEVGPPAATLGFLANVERLEERLGDDVPAIGAAVGGLVALIEAGELTRPAAAQILDDVLRHGRDPAALIAERGLAKAGDDEVAAAVDATLARCGVEVARYRAGEQKLFGYLLGQVMKQAGGKADSKTAQALLRARLA